MISPACLHAVRLAIAALLLCLALNAHAQRAPQEMLDLARAGAPGLALSMIDRLQPDRLRQQAAWLSWERTRLDLLEASERWPEVVERVSDYPADLPPDFLAWARTRQALAGLRLKQGAAARAVLRDLLWQVAPRPEPAAIRYWRRLVIESYVVEGRLRDAHVALRRYAQDYGEPNEEERILWARVLLRAGEPAQARQVLSGDERPEALALALLASLGDSGADADALRRQAQAAAGGQGLRPADRARYWQVAARAAERQQDEPLRAWYLERALAQDRQLGERDAVFAYDGDALWDGYLRIGRALGNQRQLLIGDDAAWLAAAAALGDKAVLERRALFAVVAQQGGAERSRDQAHAALIRSLLAEEGGEEVVAALYLQSARYADRSRLPGDARQVLSDYALARGDVRLASSLMGGEVRAPADADPFQWQLRRARIHILGGHEERGIDTLFTVLAQHASMDKDQADRFMQLLFDLQTAQRHEAAISLFTGLAPRIVDPQQQREVLFWQADSHKALGDYERAAWLYLRSAVLHDPHAFDPWAQTSRFYAAEALAEAGHVDDARRIYQQLLQATGEPERQVVLRQKLQALRLKE
ncbi:MAG: hypothetical protein LPK58_01125 [Gammaproteobacteria bacterium]|nr:hypothetical protein [Gammaproteobacteria bacterium]MDX5374343.1 hypothetical protein [Gammaproteobacteria bacterium]